METSIFVIKTISDVKILCESKIVHLVENTLNCLSLTMMNDSSTCSYQVACERAVSVFGLE